MDIDIINTSIITSLFIISNFKIPIYVGVGIVFFICFLINLRNKNNICERIILFSIPSFIIFSIIISLLSFKSWKNVKLHKLRTDKFVYLTLFIILVGFLLSFKTVMASNLERVVYFVIPILLSLSCISTQLNIFNDYINCKGISISQNFECSDIS